MRGKGHRPGKTCIRAGITPAYAGKSAQLNDKAAFEKGSPPPMRGKAGRLLQSKGHYRITPAYAGKSTWVWNNYDGV